MKKIYILLFTLSFLSVNAQISTDQPILTKANPSIANLMSFAEVPVNTNTGTPNISIPLASLPTRSKDVNVNVALSYHPSGISFNNKASDVGLGWNLVGEAVISRAVENIPDEHLIPFWQPILSDLEGIRFDDVYSYSFMGYTGTFKIYFNASNNSFSIQKLDYNNLKIEFEMINGTQSINSFVIYDEKGYKYVFDVKDKDTRQANTMTRTSLRHPMGASDVILDQAYLNSNFSYINAHHLSKVYDNNGKELVSYSYSTTTKYYQGSPNPSYDIKINKLSEINADGLGKVVFNYTNDNNLETSRSDTFELQSVTIKNFLNQNIKKITFEYDFTDIILNNYSHAKRRMLQNVKEFNNLETVSLVTYFYYNTTLYSLPTHQNSCHEGYYGIDKFGYLNSNVNPLSLSDGNYDMEINDLKEPSKYVLRYGILERIVYPTGARIDYDFESHTYSLPNLSENSGFDEYYVFNPDNHVYTEILNTNFDTSGQTLIPLTVTGTEPSKLYFKLTSYPYYSIMNDPVDEPLYAGMRILVNGVYRQIFNFSVSCLGEYIELLPGNYTLEIQHVGNEPAYGNIVVTKRSRTTEPVKEWFYGGGLRIKKISHYTNIDSNAMPAREINYNYQMFNNTNKSSGEIYDGGIRNFLTGSTVQTQICYKNVTIYDTENNGFTKHEYYSYFDTPQYQNNYNTSSYPNFQYYLAYKDGLLKKVEYFNSSGDLLKSILNNYTFEEYNQIIYCHAQINMTFNNFTTKPTWAKLSSSITSEFLNGSSSTPLINTESFTYNSSNLKIDTQTKINSLGESLITKFYYHSGNSTLSQNRIAEIEKIETFKGIELLNASKINYVNTFAENVSYLPENVQTSKGSNAFENRLRYVLYDEYSNPLQVQKENGLQVCYIWGYNKTQPVAKLENIAYANIPANLITDIQTLTSSPTATESQILAALNALRTSTDVNMQKAMITTYTFKPLIGVTSVTDPKGDRITYIYDDFNRLKEVRDKNDNLLSENEYRYKTQN